MSSEHISISQSSTQQLSIQQMSYHIPPCEQTMCEETIITIAFVIKSGLVRQNRASDCSSRQDSAQNNQHRKVAQHYAQQYAPLHTLPKLHSKQISQRISESLLATNKD